MAGALPFLGSAIAAAAIRLVLPATAAAVDLPVGSPVYRALDRLWAEGGAEGYWPDRLPAEAGEAAAALAGGALEWDWCLPQAAFDVRLSLLTGRAGEGKIRDNEAGVPAVHGAAGEAELSIPGALGGRMTLRFPDEENGAVRAVEAYAVLGRGRFRLTLGRESLWWGPGRRGDLLLTDNAQAPDMVRLENSPGFVLPGFLSAAGECRISLFLGRVSRARPPGAVREPLFGGVKLSASPHRNLVLSLARTFFFGGEGRQDDFRSYLDALLAREGGEWGSNVVGNQMAGISAIWRIPHPAQPVVLYAEAAGEDEANRQPSKWGFLAGVYLPRVGGCRMVDLRVEAASTDMPGQNSSWYQHADYPYVSDGRIIGHAMGNDAHDLSLEVGLFPMPGGWFGLSAARTFRGVSGPEESVETTVGLRGGWNRGPASYGLEWLSDGGDAAPGHKAPGTSWAGSVRVRL